MSPTSPTPSPPALPTLEPPADRDAWSGLEDLRPVLLKFLVRRCRAVNEAEDLIQETFVRAARYRRDLSNRARLRSWIVQIAANVFRDHVRRGGRGSMVVCEDEVLDQVEGPRPSGDAGEDDVLELGGELVDKDLLLDDLSRAVGELRSRDRTVIDSYYADGQPTALIAEHCGISPSLVKVRLFRARRRLERAVRSRASKRRTRRLLRALS